MAKSSAKKIQQVQKAGVHRSPGQRRNLAFPAVVVSIVVVGVIAVLFARDHRAADAAGSPVVDQDRWHSAFGIDICGELEPNPTDAGPDQLGIHTNGDGLIHISPFSDAAAGENARFQLFADQVGIEIDDGEFTLPDGRSFADGDPCPDDPDRAGQVGLYVWPPQATDVTEPEVFTDDLGAVRFTDDGQAFVLAFVPQGEDVSLPPSLERLENPSEEDPPTTTPPSSEGDASTTTAPD